MTASHVSTPRRAALLRLCFLWGLVACSLTGCAAMRLATAPMETLRYAQPGATRPACVIVFLPGLWDDARHYEAAQFIQATWQAGVNADMLAVEAHYGYYTSRTLIQRLRQDVVLPALAQGYTQLWLVGVSLGGFGALRYVEGYPNDITGVIALAPFLGEEEVRAEITRAGGLRHWEPAPLEDGDVTRTLWQGLQTHLTSPAGRPRLYLGYGRKDRFAPMNQLLAASLPAAQVVTNPGGHTWHTWSQLWRAFLHEPAVPCPRQDTASP